MHRILVQNSTENDYPKLHVTGLCNFQKSHDREGVTVVLRLMMDSLSVCLDNITVKEIVRELKIQREVDLHDNIIRCHGITKFESENHDNGINYMLVMEYADGGSLRNYLKNTFSTLTWNDKHLMAYQLSSAVSYLHIEGVVHRDLHSGNILVHQNTIKLADFGLILEISQGLRETVVPDTPDKYIKIYTKCWDGEPNNRPTIFQVVDWLKETPQLSNNHEFNEVPSSINNSESQGELSRLIHNFNKMDTKEIDTIAESNKQEKLSTEIDFNSIVNETNDLIFKLLNKGFEWKLVEKQFIEYFNNSNTNLQEIYNWLSNNQNSSNSIFLLAYFNLRGIGTRQLEIGRFYGIGIGIKKDVKKAFYWYEKAANNGNIVAMYNLGHYYKDGDDVKKDYNKAFKLFKQSAEGGYSNGITMLGYCYFNGIGIEIDVRKTFELYQKSADLGNMVAQYNLGVTYENGSGITKDIDKAIYWYEKSAEQGGQDAKNRLEILRKNI
ncbi:kinase-like domain-containing protein [Rhizophagus irregularis DAOM 181602=DAOM 197198]|nr:kinase-like domain-containing protein [Rhizophagus irregularis DAOM 181602=DAOM 197198]